MKDFEKDTIATTEEYSQELKNGTKVKLQISIEVTNYEKDVLPKILNFIAVCSREFYLSVGNEISSKP